MNNQKPECKICAEAYDQDDHCPRVLPTCGHTLCSICITDLFIKKGERDCPFDRNSIVFNKDLQEQPLVLDDFRKNYELIEVLEQLEKGEQDVLQSQNDQSGMDDMLFVKHIRGEDVHLGAPSVEKDVLTKAKQFFKVMPTEEGIIIEWKEETLKIADAFKASLKDLKYFHEEPAFRQYILGVNYKVYHDEIQVFKSIVQFNQLRILSIDFNQNQAVAQEGTEIIKKSGLTLIQLYLDYNSCNMVEIPPILLENRTGLIDLRLDFSSNKLIKISNLCEELKRFGFLQNLALNFSNNDALPTNEMISLLVTIRELNNLKCLDLGLSNINCVKDIFSFLGDTLLIIEKLEFAEIDVSECSNLTKEPIWKFLDTVENDERESEINFKLDISRCDLGEQDLLELDERVKPENFGSKKTVELVHSLEELIQERIEKERLEKEEEKRLEEEERKRKIEEERREKQRELELIAKKKREQEEKEKKEREEKARLEEAEKRRKEAEKAEEAERLRKEQEEMDKIEEDNRKAIEREKEEREMQAKKKTEELRIFRRKKREERKKAVQFVSKSVLKITISSVAIICFAVSLYYALGSEFNLYGHIIALCSSTLSAILYFLPKRNSLANLVITFLAFALCLEGLSVVLILFRNEISEIVSPKPMSILFLAGCVLNLGLNIFNAYKMLKMTFKKIRVVSSVLSSLLLAGFLGLNVLRNDYYKFDDQTVFYLQLIAAGIQAFSSCFSKRCNNALSFICFALLEAGIITFTLNGSNYDFIILIKFCSSLLVQIIISLFGPAYDVDTENIEHNISNRRYLILMEISYFTAFTAINGIRFYDCMKNHSGCLPYGLNIGTPLLWGLSILVFLKWNREKCCWGLFVLGGLGISVASGVLYYLENKDDPFEREKSYYLWMTLYWSVVLVPVFFTSKSKIKG